MLDGQMYIIVKFELYEQITPDNAQSISIMAAMHNKYNMVEYINNKYIPLTHINYQYNPSNALYIAMAHYSYDVIKLYISHTNYSDTAWVTPEKFIECINSCKPFKTASALLQLIKYITDAATLLNNTVLLQKINEIN